MKRNISILLIMILLLSGCNNKNTNNNNGNNGNNDKNKTYLKEDTYYMYQNGNIKKELLLRKDGTLFFAKCDYSCEVSSGTYSVNDNSIEVIIDKAYDENMCKKDSTKTTNNYVVENDTLKLNSETYNIVDKTTANDVDYYKDIKCDKSNKREERENRTETPEVAPMP